ncbi:MAG: PAS domain-containing protein [Kiritimatiellae bacterium]|nr:PAS domain-containing protein [Kiritimatiellia bacterium]
MALKIQKLEFQLDRIARRRGLLETILQAIGEGVVVVSQDGVLLYANKTAEELFGFDGAHSTGRPVERWLPDVDWQAMSRTGRDGTWHGVSSSEIEVFRPERRILSFTAFPLEADDDAEAGVVALVRDVTREREDAREAMESDRMRTIRLLAASLAHEIGNPLNALGIHLQLLERSTRTIADGEKRDELAELVRVARDEVDRLDMFLSKFLNALRGGTPEMAPCDVAKVLEKTLGTMRADIQEHEIDVEVSTGGALPKIRADSEQLQQAFFNVTRNAVQSMKRGGTLSIAVEADDRDVSVSFRDTGDGIDEDRFRRLFEPFETTRPDGHGIGLSIVQKIVRDHGGRIDVLSKPGEGTCFRLVFPILDRKARMIVAPDAAR